MASKKIVNQWLAMDAAFGAVEVPLRKPAARAAARPAGAGVPSRGAVTTGQYFQPAARSAAPPRVPGPTTSGPARPMAIGPGQAPPRPSAAPERSAAQKTAPQAAAGSPAAQPAMPKPRKPPVYVPPPAGRITDLPPLSDSDKQQQLAALQQQAQTELPKFFTEVATRVVFGEGNPAAQVVFVGEGPGAEEDRVGRPFVGRSGQLLTKMIGAMKLTREQVYIANVVKLRSAEFSAVTNRIVDRPPTAEEVARDIGYLHRQLEIIRPAVIVTLGAPAMIHLTGETEGITRVRGHWREYRGIPVMPTFHPSYVLRAYSEDNRKKTWSDLQQVMAKLGI